MTSIYRRAWILLALIGTGLAQPPLRMKAREAGRRRPAGHVIAARDSHYILQFHEYPDGRVRAELERRGMRILEYVPDNALLISAPQPNFDGLDLRWAGTLEAEDKISPLLDQQVSGPFLVEFHADVDPAQARAAATAAGFDVIENSALLATHLVVTGPYTRLEDLANRNEVKYILPAAAELAAGEVEVGCAGALTEAGAVGDYVLVGKGWPKDGAGNYSLKYFLRSMTDKLDPATVRSEIERALREWTRYAPITLSPGDQESAERSIDILFARGAHGDPYSFDGPGGTLAHTFYPAPPNSEPMAGDMHLDADESWHTGMAIDLYSVVLHEAGHALGLGHSDRPGSVMYPYYKLSTGLTNDDIAAIQALYGTPGPPAPPPNPPTPPVPTPPPAPTPTPTPPPAGRDSTPPSLQILAPGSTIVSTTVPTLTFSGTAADNVGVVAVKWTNSFGGSGVASGTTVWSVTVPLLVGTNVVTIRAYDAAGNSSWRAVTVVRR
jgi:hypothetical protein